MCLVSAKEVMNDRLQPKAEDTPSTVTSLKLAVMIRGQRSRISSRLADISSAPKSRTYDRSRPVRSEQKTLAIRGRPHMTGAATGRRIMPTAGSPAGTPERNCPLPCRARRSDCPNQPHRFGRRGRAAPSNVPQRKALSTCFPIARYRLKSPSPVILLIQHGSLDFASTQ